MLFDGSGIIYIKKVKKPGSSSSLASTQQQQQQLDQQSAVAVANFLKAYERLPAERKQAFRTRMMKFSMDRPEVFLKLWSNDRADNVEAIQWIKSRHNSLAVKLGEELIE